MICVCRLFVTNFVTDFPRAPSRTKFHYSDTNGFVADLSQTLSQTSRHVEMVCVCNFCDLCPRLSQRGSFNESQHNKIWTQVDNMCAKQSRQKH